MINNEAIIQWGYQQLDALGYQLESKLPEIIQDTPWSYVMRFATTEGYLYLKQTPEQLALEASITQILHDQFHASVPKILADSPRLNCFLMQDAGRPLREILKQQFDLELLSQAIDQFTLMQLAVADKIDLFLDIGVPDWRLDKLPALYQQLISHQSILKADGVSVKEIKQLESLLPSFHSLCKKLSDYPFKQTFVQCDFHDNNILIDESSQKITFIDLGEIVISHPFFSLLGCMQQIQKHYGLTKDDDRYLQLIATSLKNYETIDSEKHLLEVYQLAQPIWFIYSALAQYRLRNACNEAEFLSYQQYGKLRKALTDYISTCEANRE